MSSSKTRKNKYSWIPPPKPEPEFTPLPPDEKKIWEILREENIPPIKRYVKKRHHEIIIPLIIPWEYLPTKTSQAGMGAFGKRRDPNIKVDNGKLQPKKGKLESETVLPLFQETIKNQIYPTDYIMWGYPKKNVYKIEDSHKYISEEKQKLCACIIPRISLGSFRVFENMIPFGGARKQTMKITYIEGMIEGCSLESSTFISRYFEPTQEYKAGSNVIAKRRNVVSRLDDGQEVRHEKAADCLVPILFKRNSTDKKHVASMGHFRPTVFYFDEIWWRPFDKELLKLPLVRSSGKTID